jgi:phenylalanine-4-hydroxylase
MKERVRDYVETFKRPFVPRYNPLTQTIEVLDTKDKVVRYANNIKGDVTRLTSALEKIVQ